MKNNNMIIIGIVVIAALFLFMGKGTVSSQAITGSETMVITVPTGSVLPSATFPVQVTPTGTSGSWFVSVTLAITGGCTINGVNSLKYVVASDSPPPGAYTATAPSTNGSCVFSGTYKFGDLPEVNMVSKTVPVVACVPSCVQPANKCTEASTVSNGCGGFCTGSWTVTKKTLADTDCNNRVSRAELGTAAQSWIAGTFDRTELGIAAQDWITYG